MRKRAIATASALAISLAVASSAHALNENAPMMQYLGYSQLYTTYGASLANGSNVSVSLVESGGYADVADGRFADKTMIKTSSGSNTSHATNVGARFFGNDTGFSQRSVAPQLGATSGGSSVQLYTSSQFGGLFLLKPSIFPGSLAPRGSPNQSRVASHAYGAATDVDNLARMDFVVERDDFIQVVDTPGISGHGNGMNSIAVSPAQGSTSNTVNAGGIYTAGRAKPDVTGPLIGAGSDSIGQVAGVVGLIVSRGKTTTSNTSYTTNATLDASGNPLPGYTVRSGDTSEVVKAVLMAGSLRSVAEYNSGGANPTIVPAISDYRANVANQTANNLDKRYGAGMVNALQSYRIIDAGETDSAQDAGGVGGGIGQYGFDYDRHFGGASGTNAVASYGFTANATGKFMATLAWNARITGQTAPTFFDTTGTLQNLDLTLTNLTTGQVVQQSLSPIDNTENIWTDIVTGNQYMLTVTTPGGPFDWDYGLAWRSEVALTPTAVPEPAVLGAVGASAALLLRRRRG